jgi:hypothetical protein
MINNRVKNDSSKKLPADETPKDELLGSACDYLKITDKSSGNTIINSRGDVNVRFK